MEYAAPRDPLESLLAGIWAKLLKVDQVGVSDNFFEIGGHSLLGIQMLAQVEKQTGKRLPIKTLFQAPTIAQLARVIGGEKQPVHSWKNLSAIQPNGSRVPFFCVHGDEANIFVPATWARTNPSTVTSTRARTVIPSRTPRWNASRSTSSRSYAARVRMDPTCSAVIPSVGSSHTKWPASSWPLVNKCLCSRSSTPMLRRMACVPPPKRRKPTRRQRWVMRKLVNRYLDRGELLPAKLRHFHIIDTYGKATRAYHAPKYSGPITLIRANDSPGAKDMGWGKLAQGDMDVRIVEGDHYSVIKEPHVRALANELRSCIDRAMGSSSAAA
ncbi:MAG: hypothetical protein IPH53_21375 [Flavobacteriales bacterium]|nr:hypothetical protein [Flavobacteriales bacterium]